MPVVFVTSRDEEQDRARAFAVEKASKSFIRTHIFPNGCLPSIEQEDVHARAREPVGGRRTCGAGADDDGVVALHGAILTIRGTRAL